MSFMEHSLERVVSLEDKAERYSPVASGYRAAHRMRLLQKATLGVAVLLPLLVVPGWEQPFSRPKLIVWAAVVLCGMVCYSRAVWAAWGGLPKSLRVALAVWVGAVSCSALWGEFASLDALLLALTGVGWFGLLITARPMARHFSWALVIAGSVVAAVAVAQGLGADPFVVWGWVPAARGSARMRVFATLGNPNFVAAFIAGVLPLTFSLASGTQRGRRWLFGLLPLHCAAILATGSRAPMLAVAAAALWICWLRARRLTIFFAAVALCIVALVAVTSPARSLGTTLRGRIYIWKVSAPHLAEHLVAGFGPGGFAASFPEWEAQYWRRVTDDDERKLSGIEDHAHNDYLEIFADYGACGVLGFLGVLAAFLRIVVQRRSGLDPICAGASAGVAALATAALVDFPFARPAESFLFWSLMALSLLQPSPNVECERKRQVETR